MKKLTLQSLDSLVTFVFHLDYEMNDKGIARDHLA